jgi:hypothetical protein
VELGGIECVVKLAHVRLCHSRAFFLVAYPRESQEMVFDAHARNRYSVDCRYAGQVATVRIYAERIVLMSEDTMIGDHPRYFGRGQVTYNPWHYVPALDRKPGALRNGAPFKDWNLPAAMTRLRERLAKHSDGDRQFVEILSIVALYNLESVTRACAAALEDEVVSSEYVVNRLHRAAAAPLQVPDALKLNLEPAANCDRYDQLLRLTAVPVNHPPKESYANPGTDRKTQSPAPARHGRRARGKPDGVKSEEARPDELARATVAGRNV